MIALMRVGTDSSSGRGDSNATRPKFAGRQATVGLSTMNTSNDDAEMTRLVPVTDKVMSVREQGRGWMGWVAWASC